MAGEIITIAAAHAGQTLAAVLRQRLTGQSWTQVRNLVAARRVRLNGELWLDSARRLKEGDVVEVAEQSAPKPRQVEMINLRHVDAHIVVVEKPSGLSTVRHPSEREWTAERRELVPTCDDLVARQLPAAPKAPKARLRIVHRLDKETSGLLVFARSVDAERGLGKQFREHTVMRRYLAIVHGTLEAQRVESWLVRDRGDGRRGSTSNIKLGKRAATNIEIVERFPGYTMVSCQLETGRTHQIRIHLAELGHPVCGERIYNREMGMPNKEDISGAPRLALHATKLGFEHPVTNEIMAWDMPLPVDLQSFVERLRSV